MIRIKYRYKNEKEWRVKEIEESYFKRTDTYCDEWVSEELRELFYAEIPDLNYEEVFDEIEFEAGSWWNDIVQPIYLKCLKKEDVISNIFSEF